MKRIAPIIPVWAEEIEIERRGSTRLMVSGRGRSSYPIIPMKAQVAIQVLVRKSKKPIHLQFANARSSEALIEFVRKFGPIQGKRMSRTPHANENIGNPAKEDLVVQQDLGVLLREQQLFRAAVLLLRELRAKHQDPIALRNLISQVRQLQPTETTSDKKRKAKSALLVCALALAEPSFTEGPRDAVWKERMKLEKLRYDAVLPGEKLTNAGRKRQRMKANAIRYNAVVAGHGVLCEIFNRFPLQMFNCSDGGIELPSYDPTSILPVLYYLLRRDYRDRHYLIKVCKERGDSDCCNRKCYKRYNDRDRYLKKKNQKSVANAS